MAENRRIEKSNQKGLGCACFRNRLRRILNIKQKANWMAENKDISEQVILETVEYEYTLHVQACEVRMKFPCTFNLTWKVANETLESQGRLQPTDYRLLFNWSTKVRVAVLTSVGPNGRIPQAKKVFPSLRKQLSTLCLNYFSKNEPNKIKMAGFLNVDLAQCIHGLPLKKHPLERCPDKNSSVQFSITSEEIRVLTPEQASQPYSFMKMIGEQKERQASFDSPLQKARLKDTVTDLTGHYADHRGTSSRGSSARKREEINELVDKEIKNLEKTGRNSESRGRLDEQSEQLPDLLAKFKSQKQLRDVLQCELQDTRKLLEDERHITEQLGEEVKQLKSRLQNFENAPKKVSVDGRWVAEVEKLQKLLEQEMEVSRRLQSDLDSITIIFEQEKKKSIEHKRAHEELKLQYEKAKTKTPLQQDYEKLKKDQLTLETKLHNTEQQLQTSEKHLKQEREDHSKLRQHLQKVQQQLDKLHHEKQRQGTSPPKPKSTANSTPNNSLALEHRIAELETQLAQAKPPSPRPEQQQDEEMISLEVVNSIIMEFDQKEQRINNIFGVLEKECNALIQVVRDKERLEIELRQKIAQMQKEFKEACSHSPVNFQQTVENMKRSLTRMNPASKLDASPDDECPSPGDSKVSNSEYIEQLKSQYGNRLKDMSGEIVRLNELIYAQTTKDVEQDSNRDRQNYLQKANRQLEGLVRQLRERQLDLEREYVSKKILQDEVKTLTEDIAISQNQCHNLMQEVDRLRTIGSYGGQPNEIQQQLRLENMEYQRLNTDLAIELDGFRRFQKKMEDMLAQKDSQIDELRQQRSSRASLNPISHEEVEQYTQELVDALKGATASAKNPREVEDILRKLASTSLEEGHLHQNRLDRIWMMERLREISVQLQKLKLKRLNDLSGNSQLRKQFVKSVLPVQSRLDQLLLFSQGLLNCKIEQRPTQIRLLRLVPNKAE